MDNSLLISLSHQIASYRSMDVIANNLANVSTPAYQREEPTFNEYVANVRPAEGQTGTQTLSFVQDAGIVRDLSEGHLNTTNAPFDMAIHGKGYFVVQTPNGERYTRNGHFTLDNAGQITTSNGDAVQGDGGAITITPDDGEIHIAQDGTVSGKNGQIGHIRVVNFANPRALTKEGDDVAVKVQYPGIDKAIENDLKSVTLLEQMVYRRLAERLTPLAPGASYRYRIIENGIAFLPSRE